MDDMTRIISRKDAISQGLTQYFTGKPCSKGHVEFRYTCDHACGACAREKTAAYRKKNPEIVKRNNAINHAKRAASPESRKKDIERAREWALKNPEEYRARQRKHYLDNREQRLEYSKSRIAEKRKDPEWVEKERLRKRIDKKKNWESVRANSQVRRARKRGAEGRYSAEDIKAILKEQNGGCTYCKIDIAGRYDVDHKTPLSRGGSNWPSNLQCLCPECNGKKWARTHEEYLALIEKAASPE